MKKAKYNIGWQNDKKNPQDANDNLRLEKKQQQIFNAFEGTTSDSTITTGKRIY